MRFLIVGPKNFFSCRSRRKEHSISNQACAGIEINCLRLFNSSNKAIEAPREADSLSKAATNTEESIKIFNCVSRPTYQGQPGGSGRLSPAVASAEPLGWASFDPLKIGLSILRPYLFKCVEGFINGFAILIFAFSFFTRR